MNLGGAPVRTDPPLRVSYLLSQFPVPTEAFAVSDIAALIALGHEVAVHTMKPRPRDDALRMESCAVPPGLSIFRPSITGALRWPSLLWRYKVGVLSLIRAIMAGARSEPLTAFTALLCIPRIFEIVDETRDFQSQVVHAFWSRHAGMTLHVMASASTRPALTAFAGAYDMIADDFIVDMTLRSADAVFSHAEVNRRFVESKARERVPVHIIHRGIPLAEPICEERRDPHRWVSASALVRSKNVAAVVRAFARAHRSEPRMTLELFGDGPERKQLIELCAHLGCRQAVHFMGHVPRDQLFAHMQQARLFILLSKKPSERLPNVVKEALLAGAAVISSASAGIEDLIPDSRYGFVVNPDDAEAIAAAVAAVARETKSDAAVRQSLTRALVRERFSSDTSMQLYAAAWRDVLRSPNRAGAAHGLPQCGIFVADPVQ